MPRSHRRLTALSISRKLAAGYYADGDGLYLQITGRDARSWIFRFMPAGRRREMGLGAPSEVSLADARQKATAKVLDLIWSTSRDARSSAARGSSPGDGRNGDPKLAATEVHLQHLEPRQNRATPSDRKR
jgi:hypothetical protein